MADTAVDKALLLLRALTAERPASRGVRELAERAGIPRATCHRLLQTLLKHGYVRQDPASQRYLLGIRAIELGFAALRGVRLRDIARPLLERLVAACNETASLTVLDGPDTAYIDRVDCSHPVRLAAEIGSRNPAWTSAAGRTLLAFLERGRAEALIPMAWAPLTARSVTGRAVLMSELERISARGYAVDDEEWAEGVYCVAAPIYGYDGQVQAALSVVGATSRFHLKRDALIALVVETAAQISAEMGHGGAMTEPRQPKGEAAHA